MSRILFAIELTRSNDTCPLMPQATNIAWRITTGVGRMQKKTLKSNARQNWYYQFAALSHVGKWRVIYLILRGNFAMNVNNIVSSLKLITEWKIISRIELRVPLNLVLINFF